MTHEERITLLSYLKRMQLDVLHSRIVIAGTKYYVDDNVYERLASEYREAASVEAIDDYVNDRYVKADTEHVPNTLRELVEQHKEEPE